MESQIIDLQIKLTHQEDLLDQLNQIVTKQQFTIDNLVKEVRELKLTSISGQGEISNEKPPHY
jgi:SlyX protein